MKKKGTLSDELFRALLRGLAIFAVFGASLYAYAINYPEQPGPVSGVVGVYVGQTAGTYDGKLKSTTGGYVMANGLCDPVVKDSHICTPLEIVNTYNHNKSAVENLTGVVWLNSGAPANTTPAVNDCRGWQDYTTDFYGNVWSFSKKYSGILPCKYFLPIACCK